MSKRTRITNEIIEKVWELYSKGVEYKQIALRLGISQASIIRCVTAMSQASIGRFVEYDGLLKDSHHIADYANKKFNLQRKDVEEKESSDLTEAVNKLADKVDRQADVFENFFKKFDK